MMATKAPEFDAQLLTGIGIALPKARELGYPVERMDVTASISEGVCSVHFAPLAKPGTIKTGGDLSLSIVRRQKRGERSSPANEHLRIINSKSG